MANLASTIRLLRAERDLTQTQLAEKAGLHYRTVQDIEAGNTPRLVTCVRLARALDVPLERLTGDAA